MITLVQVPYVKSAYGKYFEFYWVKKNKTDSANFKKPKITSFLMILIKYLILSFKISHLTRSMKLNGIFLNVL